MAKLHLKALTDDLDWREKELGSLKLILARRDISDTQKAVLLRASWALLYAHYEGFVKTALTIFFDAASRVVERCGLLPEKTRLFALDAKLRRFKNLPPAEFLSAIENFSSTHYDTSADFPEVDTKSNLWPNVFEDLLQLADVSVPALQTHRAKLYTLVSRRNKIAHGNADSISEVDYYRGFESAVYDVMYELAFGMDERLGRSPYS